MQSPCMREASQACFHGCCPTPFLGLTEAPHPKTITSAAASRYDFATATASSLFPNTQFTNHESLPSLHEAFSNFTKAYPHYTDTDRADNIRAHEYYHLSLSNRVCLDYVGFGLFSHSQHQSSVASSSNFPPSAPSPSEFSFFNISYKSASLHSQVLYGSQETELESSIRKRIMGFLNISDNDYRMVCTANRASAFKLLAESYPFQSNQRLLTVYDYESEAVSGMIENSRKRGARIMSANFSWPSLRIHSAKLRKMLVSKRKKRKGLFVFPLQSRMTGTRYSYLWMSLAQENGWQVLLDACALGPKDMDTLGLSLFRPDFLICSFFKVFGENPSGFGCLFVKRSSISVLETSTIARSIGIVGIVPAKLSQPPDDDSITDTETQISKLQLQEDVAMTCSFSGRISRQVSNGLIERSSSSERRFERGETSELYETEVNMKQKESLQSEIVELEKTDSVLSGNTDSVKPGTSEAKLDEMDQTAEIECKGLDHADSLGLLLISSRVRFLTNWLVNALTKLRHPNSEKGLPLIRIYGPKVKFDRGPAVAFNVFDWKGEKVEPALVQKLADRNNISLSYGFLHNILFSDKYEDDKEKVLETRTPEVAIGGNRMKEKVASGISVVTAAIGFLANFEDTYRLWAFVAKFLDADFVEKEKWRYMALNQEMIEI
ncbi:uncharacterized protein LOC131233350 [Magnolia sinica]|uniref:uncharacterized protein LOC131233350 n=1 Tax=Magnolia sinica TaxID=86752 RepID=UPI0026595099|nr:uncharacterized protein LOC131233350 [Magnolia sinica]